MRATSLGAAVGMLLLSAGYVGLALACLYRWGEVSPWSRMDVFSGGYLVVMVAAILIDLAAGLGRGIVRSPEMLREVSGMTYDSATLVVMGLVQTGDALVFLDYGHWRLLPALAQPGLQGLGLALTAAAAAWVSWADARLAGHFVAPPAERTLIEDGPFRHVRIHGMRLCSRCGSRSR